MSSSRQGNTATETDGSVTGTETATSATETETETGTETGTGTASETATATATETATESDFPLRGDETDGRKAYPRKSRSQLPPLEDRGKNLGLGNQPPPAAEGSGPAVRVPTTGGSSYRGAGDAAISIPEVGGGFPLRSEGHIISMPGEDRSGVSRKAGDLSRSSIEIAVYFMDRTGLSLQVENGQNMKAGEMFEKIKTSLNYPDEARDVFSLWLVSDLLELQLKPTHVPFKLACFWDELLERYTDADAQDIERDEPVLMFQRNVFFSRKKEQQLDSPELLRLLYCEARKNVLDSRYPVTLEEYDKLAGLQALIHYRTWESDTHTEEHYRGLLNEYYPEHLCKTKWTFPGFGSKVKDPRERHVADGHRQNYREFGELEAPEHLKKAYEAYLQICWKLPYYGGAYFSGQIEHPGRHFFRNNNDDPVFVAINTDGVFVIDMDDTEFLLGLLYEDLSWEYAEPKNRENRNCMPCLFLQFGDQEDGEKVSKVLQIFSREAVLMDALINSCIKLKDATGAVEDNSLDMADGVDDGIVRSGSKTWKKFNRMCLTTFNKKGECISQARSPKKR